MVYKSFPEVYKSLLASLCFVIYSISCFGTETTPDETAFIKQVAEACVAGSHEKADCELLRQGSEKFGLPELADLATVLENRTLDVGKKHKIAATSSLLQYAEKKYGESSYQAIVCRRVYISATSQINGPETRAGALKNFQQAKALSSKNPTNEQYKILELITRLERIISTDPFDEDCPENWQEIWHVTKEAIPFLRNRKNDQDCIDLRNQLHQLISRNTTYIDYVYVHLLNSILPDQIPEDVYSDTDGFLAQTIESCKELYGANDIRTLIAELKLLELQMNSQSKDYTTLHSRISDIQNTLTAYCPANDILPVEAELLKWDCDIAFMQNTYELMSPLSVLNKIADFYGEESEMYLVYMFRIMYQQLAVNPDRASSLCKDIRTLAEKIYSSDSDEYGFFLQNMFHAMQALSEQNPQLLQDYVTDICNYYRSHHRPTWLSISIGRNLAIYLHDILQNNNLAYEIHNISFSDLSSITPESSTLYAYCLYDLALAQINATDSAINHQAESTLKDCMRLYNNSKMSSAHISFNLAQLQFSHHKYNEAVNTLRQGISRCVRDEEKPWRCHMQLTLGNFGLYSPDISLSQGEIDDLFNKAIPAFEQQENHDGVFLEGFRIIGDYYRYKKQYPEAEKMYRQGIEYAESHYGNTERNEYIDLISGLSDLYLNELDEKDKAEQLMEGKIEALHNDPYFARHDQLLNLLWNQYYLISSKSDDELKLAALLSIQQEAMSIIQRSGNDEHLAMSLLKPIIYEYGFFFSALGKSISEIDALPPGQATTQEIETLRHGFHQQREQFKAQFPPIFNYIEEDLKKNNPNYLDDSETVRLYSTIFEYYLAVENDTTRGESYLQRLTQSGNFINRYRATHQLAQLKIMQNRPLEAIQLLQQVKSMANQDPIAMSSPDNKAEFNWELFTAYFKSGQYEKAIAPARDFFHYQQLMIQQNFDLLTQSEREQFVNNKGGAGSYCLLELLPHFPQRLAGECYDAQLAQKCLLLRASERIKKHIQQSQDPALIARMDSLNHMSMMLKSMSSAAQPGHDEATIYNPEYIKLKQQIEALERAINRQAMQAMGATSAPEWKQLQQVLRKGEAAIEFVVTDTIGALVLLPQGEPVYVPLDQAGLIWKELQETSNMKAGRKARELYEADRFHLYERIWQPLESRLEGASVVFFSPSGFLNDLVFTAIKCNDKQYLADRYELRQLLSTGNLIDLRRNTSAGKPHNAAIIGGIYYSPAQEELALSVPAATEDERGAILDDEEAFGYLPFTLSEVKKLGRLFSENNLTSRQGTGFEPTEQSLTALSNNSPDVLHLSTHGFYVDPEDVASNHFLSRFPLSKFSSMQRCGLALVDANRTWEGSTDRPENNDGIITANEVALLDLSNTRLTVLSACRTAVGEYNGEGVFGMHRGFKQAGVKSIIGTMWNVNDESTARFMELFYQRWLADMPMQQSFNEAVKELRKEYPSPYYWAPFILIDALD